MLHFRSEIVLFGAFMEDIHGQLMEYNELCKETDALYRQVAECSELSDAMFWVLYTVCARKGSCSPKDVCDAWTMHKQTVHSEMCIRDREKSPAILLAFLVSVLQIFC